MAAVIACEPQPRSQPTPPSDLSARLCRTSQKVPALAGECARLLEASLAAGALTLDAVLAERCIAGTGACGNVLSGSVAAGAVCSSSLECEAGLRCRGVGPARAGLCALPGEPGTTCNTSIDPLESYLPRQDAAHPACSGFCANSRCWPLVAAGGACAMAEQCATQVCDNRRCAAR